MEFKILKKSSKSKARAGLLKTPHGTLETPAFVPVATQASIKAMDNGEVYDTKTQIIICNTFHLHLRPGENFIKESGGLHKYANWKIPIMTDSGGFQVFSLGFGSDLGVGKVIKFFPGDVEAKIHTGDQPVNAKITDDGVFFRSPHDGTALFIGPKESMEIQKKLRADIIFAFDECTAPFSTKEYILKALERTHRWAKICWDEHDNNQALFGIVQGSKFKELRIESSKFIGRQGFDGYGIGGDLGVSKDDIVKILNWVTPYLEETKPRHLLGIGYLEDMEMVIKNGVDLFDCIVPTQYGRHGQAFTSEGRLNLRGAQYLKDKNALDKKCDCFVCQEYKRNYISHLIRAHEITALKLLSYHNLYFFNRFVEKIRNKIKEDKL